MGASTHARAERCTGGHHAHWRRCTARGASTCQGCKDTHDQLASPCWELVPPRRRRCSPSCSNPSCSNLAACITELPLLIAFLPSSSSKRRWRAGRSSCWSMRTNTRRSMRRSMRTSWRRSRTRRPVRAGRAKQQCRCCAGGRASCGKGARQAHRGRALWWLGVGQCVPPLPGAPARRVGPTSAGSSGDGGSVLGGRRQQWQTDSACPAAASRHHGIAPAAAQARCLTRSPLLSPLPAHAPPPPRRRHLCSPLATATCSNTRSQC